MKKIQSHAVLLLGDYNLALEQFNEVCKSLGVSQYDQTIFAQDFQIENARYLIKWLYIRPLSSLKKCAFINLENVQLPALNSILKIIEEPPEYGQIVLYAPNEKSVIATIKSRCQRIWLSNAPLDKSIKINYDNILQTISEVPSLIEKYSVGEILSQIILDTKSLEIPIEKKAKVLNYFLELSGFSKSNANKKMIIENALLKRWEELGDI